MTKLSAQNIQCLKFELRIATFFAPAAVSHNIDRGWLSYSNEPLLSCDLTHGQGLLLSHPQNLKLQKRSEIYIECKSTK